MLSRNKKHHNTDKSVDAKRVLYQELKFYGMNEADFN